jgi:hypothetical protein
MTGVRVSLPLVLSVISTRRISPVPGSLCECP